MQAALLALVKAAARPVAVTGEAPLDAAMEVAQPGELAAKRLVQLLRHQV